MKGMRKGTLVVGLLLILLGSLMLLVRFVPALQVVISWPLIIVGVGLFLLIMGLVTGAPGMAVPACITGGIGLLLWWQNATGHWGSWAYAWTLIPGFTGVGLILAGLLGEKPGETIKAGGILILISLIMFTVFGSFLGGFGVLGKFWPVLIIALGVLLLVSQFLFKPRR